MSSSQSRQKSTVQDRSRHRWATVSIHPHYGFVCGRHDAAWQPRSRSPQDWDLGCLEATGWAQESMAFLDAAVHLLHVRGAVRWWTFLLEQKVVTRHSAYRLLQYDVIMTSWSSIEEFNKRYHQNFLLCSNNEIATGIADLFNSFFVKKCMRLHFSRLCSNKL